MGSETGALERDCSKRAEEKLKTATTLQGCPRNANSRLLCCGGCAQEGRAGQAKGASSCLPDNALLANSATLIQFFFVVLITNFSTLGYLN